MQGTRRKRDVNYASAPLVTDDHQLEQHKRARYESKHVVNPAIAISQGNKFVFKEL
jgi:hypothetical protein